jgi:hypothetical protein
LATLALNAKIKITPVKSFITSAASSYKCLGEIGIFFSLSSALRLLICASTRRKNKFILKKNLSKTVKKLLNVHFQQKLRSSGEA